MTARTAAPVYTTGFVTSKDSTTIGYRQLGSGPAVILVHGGMQGAQNFMKLATALSDRFTVILPDRRGRGLSGPYGENFTIQDAVDDMQALIADTGAQDVFALSAGAVVALQSALLLPEIKRLAVYEPPLDAGGLISPAWVTRLDHELDTNNLAAAMVTVMKGTGDTSIFAALPRFVTQPMISMALKSDAEETLPGDAPISDLVRTMHYDVHMVMQVKDTIDIFSGVSAEVLLLGGSKSAFYLKRALDRLEVTLPHVRRVEFPGLDHLAADNGGHPEHIAEELRRFFSAA